MVCVDTDEDEDGNSVWLCECGYLNLEAFEADECHACGKYWE